MKLLEKKKIIEYLNEHDSMNRTDVENLLNLSTSRAKIILNSMCEKGYIIKTGNGRSIMYVLNK